MGFVHLKAQVLREGAEEKARRVVEVVVAFCRRIGGHPKVDEVEETYYRVVCLTEGRTSIDISFGTTTKLTISTLVAKAREELNLTEVPDAVVFAFKHPNLCVAGFNHDEAHMSCVYQGGKGFKVDVSKSFRIMIITGIV